MFAMQSVSVTQHGGSKIIHQFSAADDVLLWRSSSRIPVSHCLFYCLSAVSSSLMSSVCWIVREWRKQY